MPDSVNMPPGASAPIYPSAPVEVETRKAVTVHEAPNGARYFIRRSKAFRFYTLQYNLRSLEEYNLMRVMWLNNYPRTPVLWTNTEADTGGEEFYIDAPIKSVPQAANALTYYIVLRAKTPQAIVVPDDNIVPFSPSYGYDTQDAKAVNLSDGVSFARAVASLSGKKRSFNLVFKNRQLTEFLEMEEFWDYHYPGKTVSFVDSYLGVTLNYRFTSNLKWSLKNEFVEYSFSILEV
jgi:hypothetical protein